MSARDCLYDGYTQSPELYVNAIIIWPRGSVPTVVKISRAVNYCSLVKIIFSRSLRLGGSWLFFVCFRTFSWRLLMASNSSLLISRAFLMLFGTWRWRLILRISGICEYRWINAWSYSSFALWRALLTPLRSDALVRQSRTLPSSDPEMMYLLSGVNLAEKTLHRLLDPAFLVRGR